MQQHVKSFLALPIPPFPSEQSELWKQKAVDLGKSAIPVLINALADGDWNEQYAALLTLRYLGVSASARGYGRDLVYEVDLSDDSTVPGTGMIIVKPKISDDEYDDLIFEAPPAR